MASLVSSIPTYGRAFPFVSYAKENHKTHILSSRTKPVVFPCLRPAIPEKKKKNVVSASSTPYSPQALNYKMSSRVSRVINEAFLISQDRSGIMGPEHILRGLLGIINHDAVIEEIFRKLHVDFHKVDKLSELLLNKCHVPPSSPYDEIDIQNKRYLRVLDYANQSMLRDGSSRIRTYHILLGLFGESNIQEAFKSIGIDQKLVELAISSLENGKDLLDRVKSTPSDEDIIQLMDRVSKTTLAEELTQEEKNVWIASYIRFTMARRAQWRMYASIGKQHGNEVMMDLIERELPLIYERVMSILSWDLKPTHSSRDYLVFYLKLELEYRRYMGELKSGSHRDVYDYGTYKSYGKVQKFAAGLGLLPTNANRLSLALSYSTFAYEVMDSVGAACSIAEEALVEARAELHNLESMDNTLTMLLDTIGEESHAPSIMLLLEKNLTKWRNEEQDDLEMYY